MNANMAELYDAEQAGGRESITFHWARLNSPARSLYARVPIRIGMVVIRQRKSVSVLVSVLFWDSVRLLHLCARGNVVIH